MKIIVAADKKWGIGYRNKLLVSIPKDMKHFKECTTGNVIVLGRKTMETFPGGRPLPNRTNIVLSGNKNLKIEGATVVNDIQALLEELKKYDSDSVYIVGGESIYRQMLPYCDTAIVTKIDHAYSADAFFTDLDSDPEWEIADESDEEYYFDVIYTFTTYKRK